MQQVNDRLGINSTALLFDDEGWSLLHTTSVVRYPTFVGGENYTGHRPPLLRASILHEFLIDVLAPKSATIPGALVVPLGSCVSHARRLLVDNGSRCARRG